MFSQRSSSSRLGTAPGHPKIYAAGHHTGLTRGAVPRRGLPPAAARKARSQAGGRPAGRVLCDAGV